MALEHYKNLHKIPEISEKEFKTSKYIYDTLANIGYSPIIVGNTGKNGNALPKAFEVNSIPAIPDTFKYSLETTITKAVATPTITVSTKGCSIDINACFTGLEVFTAENAIGAVPKPDSFANIALLNPHNKQANAPPVIALGENASFTISTSFRHIDKKTAL